MRIEMDDDFLYSCDGMEVYRSDALEGAFVSVGLIDADDFNDNYDAWNDSTLYAKYYVFTDATALEVGKTYYYEVRMYKDDEIKTYTTTMKTEVTILGPGTTITTAKRNGKLGISLAWNSVANAQGYVIYYAKNYDELNQYTYVDSNDITKFSVLQTVPANQTSLNLKNLVNGVTYTFRIVAVNVVNGKNQESALSPAASVVMDYYTYDGEDYTKRIKRAFGSEKKKKKNFSSAAKASKQMKTIRIKVWDFQKGKKGKKVTRIKSLTVNKKLAPSITQIFKEIYNSSEKQVIHDIGCFSYRTGEHMYGMAIDINANENYMIDGKKIMCGSYWKPGKDPYSIPNDSDFVRIMNRYGFYRGAWGARKDYMHFSYFGT